MRDHKSHKTYKTVFTEDVNIVAVKGLHNGKMRLYQDLGYH